MVTGLAEEHEASPEPFSAFTMSGPNTGRVAVLGNVWHYPAEALCQGCGAMIRADRYGEAWAHTGRMPGDPR